MGAFRHRRRGRGERGDGDLPLVCHVSPTYFSPESVIGGGERFAEELARAMSSRVRVRFVSFGATGHRERRGPGYEHVVLRSLSRSRFVPVSAGLFRALAGADVIHCHQYYVLSTFLAALYGKLRRRPVFVSDLGGGGWTPAFHFDQSRWIEAHLPLSEYAAELLPGANQRREVIYGGVDLESYPPRPAPEHDGTVVFLGRLLPHKGIHYLIQGLPRGVSLEVIGTAVEPAYRARLERLADGKRVRFLHGLTDDEVKARLRRAMVLVHPTPVDENGSPGVSELLGLAPLEAMACGCPVIASAVGPLPEIVADGSTGLLVPPNDPEAIGRAIETVRSDLELWKRLSSSARTRVEREFSWQRVVDRCLAAYGLDRSGRPGPDREVDGP